MSYIVFEEGSLLLSDFVRKKYIAVEAEDQCYGVPCVWNWQACFQICKRSPRQPKVAKIYNIGK